MVIDVDTSDDSGYIQIIATKEPTNMTTIQVTTDIEALAARAAVDSRLANDPNWNGAEVQIVRGDCLSIDGADECAGAELLSAIHTRLEPAD